MTGEPPEMQAAILLEVACLPLHDEHCGAFLAEASALCSRALELSSDPSVAREVQEALRARAVGSGAPTCFQPRDALPE